jgi:hypothetical protein
MHQYLPPPIAGIIASAGSVITTFQVQLDWGLRIAGSAVFLLIAILSLFRAIRDFNQKYRP